MAGSILGTLLLNIVAKADTNGLNKTNTALKKVGRTAQSTGKNIGFLSRLSGSLMGGFNFSVISNAFRNYLQFEKDLGAMKSRFFAITKDERQATEEFDYIRDVALRTAQDVKSTADSYSIFYSSARRALGKEGAREVFESWTEVGRVLHMNEQQFERVTYALREMSSKGTLYSQDLKMQLGTHVPDAINIATTAIQNMGIKGVDTIEKFQKLTKTNPKGGYMAKFLIEFSKEAKSRFATPEALAKALQQPDALAQAIKNTGFIFLEQFSRRGGGKLLASILIGIQKLIEKFPMEKATAFLGNLASMLGSFINFAIDNLTIIVSLLSMIAKVILISKGISLARGGYYANKQGKLLPWMALKLGLGKDVAKGLMFGFAKAGLKEGIIKGLGLLGGPILTALLWLPDIIRIIKWIAQAIDKKFNITDKKWINKPFADSDLTVGQVANIAGALQRDLSSGKIHNRVEWANKVAGYGGSSIFTHLDYHDDGKVYIYNTGTREWEVSEVFDKFINEKQKIINKANNKAYNPTLFKVPKGH